MKNELIYFEVFSRSPEILYTRAVSLKKLTSLYRIKSGLQIGIADRVNLIN